MAISREEIEEIARAVAHRILQSKGNPGPNEKCLCGFAATNIISLVHGTALDIKAGKRPTPELLEGAYETAKIVLSYACPNAYPKTRSILDEIKAKPEIAEVKLRDVIRALSDELETCTERKE